MKPIVARKQVRLSSWRCLRLSLNGLAYRLFRSLVTVSVLGLAVAFLAHVLAYGLIAQGTRSAAVSELNRVRLLGEWVARLSEPDGDRAILEEFASPAASDRRAEYGAWSGATPALLAGASATARELATAWRDIQALPPARQAALTSIVEADDPLAFAAQLADPGIGQRFRARLAELDVPSLLRDEATFERLVLRDAPAFEALRQRIRGGQQLAIARVRTVAGDAAPLRLLADPPADLHDVLTAAGFRLPRHLLAPLREQALDALDMETLDRMLARPEVREGVRRRRDLPAAALNAAGILMWIDSDRRAAALAAAIGPFAEDRRFTPARLRELSSAAQRRVGLETAAGEPSVTPGGDGRSLPAATVWLIAISLLVCVVGVANAMLMSVTERFTEIATMKCLGALNRSVVRVFLFEALVQGGIGSLLGAALGTGLAVARGVATFGSLAWHALPLAGLLAGAGAACACGVALAALAAAGPVWAAARLMPLEAMRIE
jgi:putative ABC transport system permease protein